MDWFLYDNGLRLERVKGPSKKKELETLEGDTYGEFEKKIYKYFKYSCLIKTKMIRFNNNVFLIKEFTKEITKRSKLRNKFNRK